MKRFSPVSDELLYRNPQLWRGLVPYEVGSRQPQLQVKQAHQKECQKEHQKEQRKETCQSPSIGLLAAPQEVQS